MTEADYIFLKGMIAGLMLFRVIPWMLKKEWINFKQALKSMEEEK